MRALPAPVQRWLAILLPPLALLVCCFVMVPRHKKMQQLQADIKATQASIADYQNKLRAIANLPKDPRVATLPMTKQEQSDFLRDLSGMCGRNGNKLLTIGSLAPTIPAPPPPGAPPPPPGALPADVLEVKSTMTFEGDFTSLRKFLATLQDFPRLISLTDCRIGPGHDGYPMLMTTLTVSRYVDLPKPAAPAPATTAATGAPGKTT